MSARRLARANNQAHIALLGGYPCRVTARLAVYSWIDSASLFEGNKGQSHKGGACP